MSQNRTLPIDGWTRDGAVEAISALLTGYAQAMGGIPRCDPAVLELHYAALRSLLTAPDVDAAKARTLTDALKALGEHHIAAEASVP
jgi:hypothetical protein